MSRRDRGRAAKKGRLVIMTMMSYRRRKNGCVFKCELSIMEVCVYIALYIYIYTYGVHPLSEKCFHLMKDSPLGCFSENMEESSRRFNPSQRSIFPWLCRSTVDFLPPKFNSKRPWKNGGWKTSSLLGPGNFSEAMLNFQGVRN